jgi:hypothetical protein
MTETTYRVVSSDGRSYNTVTVTEEQSDRIYEIVKNVFEAGVERFGSVEAFHCALEAHHFERTGEIPDRYAEPRNLPSVYVRREDGAWVAA